MFSKFGRVRPLHQEAPNELGERRGTHAPEFRFTALDGLGRIRSRACGADTAVADPWVDDWRDW